MTLAPGTFASLLQLQITDDAESTVYGSVNPLSDTPSIQLTTPITATTTSTQYKIRVRPESHALMPSPPGSSYALTARVSSWTGSNFNHAGSDSGGTTVTIDNLSPGNVTRRHRDVRQYAGHPGVDQSAEQRSRNDPRAAAGRVRGRRHAGRRRDLCGREQRRIVNRRVRGHGAGDGLHRHRAGQRHGLPLQDLRERHQRQLRDRRRPHRLPVTPNLTTLGNGTDPANATVAPGGAATMADAFTFQTGSGTDAITAVTVTLAPGTSAGVSLVEITNDAGSDRLRCRSAIRPATPSRSR